MKTVIMIGYNSYVIKDDFTSPATVVEIFSRLQLVEQIGWGDDARFKNAKPLDIEIKQYDDKHFLGEDRTAILEAELKQAREQTENNSRYYSDRIKQLETQLAAKPTVVP